MTPRESLAGILRDAAEEAGGWRELGEKLFVNHNSLWRAGHPDETPREGKAYLKSLPNGETLNEVMKGLGLVFSYGQEEPTVGQVCDLIRRMKVDCHTRVCMMAAVRAIWLERQV